MERESRNWLAFVGMLVAIAGILTMARINDREIVKVNKKAQEAIKKLCAPPYGANVASAGLFFGVFIAPRLEKLSIVKN